MDINEITTKLRDILTQYRSSKRSETPIDINSIDIALSLVEYSIKSKRK